MTITRINTVITWLFYLLFFSVPIILSGKTSELFEFNKMWLTFGIAICIGAAWISKMLVEKRFVVKRTIFDIPLLLFLASQCIATLFSWDRHISLWGYYSRFNGGFLSIFTYVFLYYAFVTNLGKKAVWGSLFASLASGLVVALWGIPSHFGHDPTCLLFRGTFDVDCWTFAFQPTVRAFSTLGQPAWLAAYMAILIPFALVLFLKHFSPQTEHKNKALSQKNLMMLLGTALLLVLFYLSELFANTRGGFIGFALADVAFWLVLFAVLQMRHILNQKHFMQAFAMCNGIFILCSFVFGSPISQLDRFTLPTLTRHAAVQETTQTAPKATSAPKQVVSPGDLGGTDSGIIRSYVWRGALDAWKAHPIFGTGVETFAFAYYEFRPAAHNMTSEWDYLYNKAHNEYLNYLATTGIVGLGTYLAFIIFFFYVTAKALVASDDRLDRHDRILFIGLLAAVISILITNFFGFSVVIINLYLFLIPAFVIVKLERPSETPEKMTPHNLSKTLDPYQKTGIVTILVIAFYLLYLLNRFWRADVSYAMGSNLDHVGEYVKANPYLVDAVKLRGSEPVFQDELSYNLSVLTQAYVQQKQTGEAGTLANQAIAISNDLTTRYPHNIVFWKNRVRIFFNLSQLDAQFVPQALDAVKTVHALAPTDAKVEYNLGIVYGQSGDLEQGIQTLKQALALKPDYVDAYYALGIMYHQAAVDKNNKVVDPAKEQDALNAIKQALTYSPNNAEVLKTLKSWGESL